MSADAAGGRPLYVAGQNGDGYLRWYNPNTIGPPGGVRQVSSGWIEQGNGDGQWYHFGGVTVPWTGYYVCTFQGSAGNFASGGNSNWRMWVAGTLLAEGNGGNGWEATIGLRWMGFLGANSYISMEARVDNQGYSGSVRGEVICYFVPEMSYPN
jgi:hypothetical protein